jgi:hypothetical protein
MTRPIDPLLTLEVDYVNGKGLSQDLSYERYVKLHQLLGEPPVVKGLRVEFIQADDNQKERKTALGRLARGGINALIGTTTPAITWQIARRPDPDRVAVLNSLYRRRPPCRRSVCGIRQESEHSYGRREKPL